MRLKDFRKCAAYRSRSAIMAQPVTPSEDPVLRPWSGILTEAIGRTGIPVDQKILTTSLLAHFECMLGDGSDRGGDIADLLNEGPGAFFDRNPDMHNDVWSTTALRTLSSALARLATSPDPNAGPAALESEACSAITEALQHTIPIYEGMNAPA